MAGTSNDPPIEVIARGLIRQEGSILCCRDVQKRYRYLPGGHVEPGEPAATALARELAEEAGLACRVGPMALVAEVGFEQGGRRRHEINLVFHVELAGVHGRGPVPSLEPGIAFDWVPEADLGIADVRPDVIKAWLADLLAHPAQAALQAPPTPVWRSSFPSP